MFTSFLLMVGTGMGIGFDFSEVVVDFSELVELVEAATDFSECVELEKVELEKLEVGDEEASEGGSVEESEGELETELAPETCLKS